MPRRGLSLALLALFAVQLLGGIALATVCLEPCPDDGDGTSCPPVCALCTSCTHAQPALVHYAAILAPSLPAERFLAEAVTAAFPEPASDIFHVPLRG